MIEGPVIAPDLFDGVVVLVAADGDGVLGQVGDGLEEARSRSSAAAAAASRASACGFEVGELVRRGRRCRRLRA